MATTDLLIQSTAEIEALVPSVREGGTLISLARSGDSPESRTVIQKFQKLYPRVRHLVILCNPNGLAARLPDVQVILLDERTNDRSLAMTGSFTNLVLAGLALARREQIATQLSDICGQVERGLLESNEFVRDVAQASKDRIAILSSVMQALAKEVALKITELTDGRVLTMSETFLGLRHGPVGFLREDTPVLCFLSSDPQKRQYEEDLMEDLRGKGLGRLIVVGDHPASATERDWYVSAAAPSLPDALRTPFEMPFAQLMAYHLSVKAKVDPDNPSPKGTITRVVRPFQIYEDLTMA